MNKDKVKDYLQTLLDSCAEGFTGEWDASGEGVEGFEDMGIIVQRIAKELNITLEEPDFYPDEEE